jgi:predicted MFS family arabinose efflux permease
MLGAGGIVVVALSAYFGRLPVLFWFSILAFLTAAWSAAATTFQFFAAARILHGFFSTVAQAVSFDPYLPIDWKTIYEFVINFLRAD